jgi:hypothetical protein
MVCVRGHRVDDKARFCEQCGAPVVCPHCGKSNRLELLNSTGAFFQSRLIIESTPIWLALRLIPAAFGYYSGYWWACQGCKRKWRTQTKKEQAVERQRGYIAAQLLESALAKGKAARREGGRIPTAEEEALEQHEEQMVESLRSGKPSRGLTHS